MKSKFGNFDFGSVEVLSRAEAAKVKGGAYGGAIGLSPGITSPTIGTCGHYCAAYPASYAKLMGCNCQRNFGGW